MIEHASRQLSISVAVQSAESWNTVRTMESANMAQKMQHVLCTHNCEECEKQNCHVLFLFFKLLGLKFKFKLFGTKW